MVKSHSAGGTSGGGVAPSRNWKTFREFMMDGVTDPSQKELFEKTLFARQLSGDLDENYTLRDDLKEMFDRILSHIGDTQMLRLRDGYGERLLDYLCAVDAKRVSKVGAAGPFTEEIIQEARSEWTTRATALKSRLDSDSEIPEYYPPSHSGN